ncbi:xanthine dehydrogenase family protein molybdopterin-binding subunit [Haliangium ochraceum]|uniref:Aldehyde oxidase and xanthine dehydrogenase molybdopterin binding protein n=1 Tax=Haliangium ochraceum (strain DSM 14365 / JCM 11303 / SMP-2) TaxID=502025 RepID=D0LUM6_HALO1|nr:xanthine dehydrogenase family protein molybdopterin-binding subunit [Haliangium ochraceum]ACY13916.1 aldehyde oxidase and xanthine dehydrogenase molybdopterin binding protein [Haliangium ochraceum DSM 14365]
MSDEGRPTAALRPIGDILGKSVPRPDARGKVTGGAVYTDDITLPGMLYGAILGSPYAHARILSYDTSRARAMPGVVAVITAEDLPDINFGTVVKDQPVLARGKVRHMREPVAAVAAVDLATARRALEEIEVQYEELDAVYDVEAALEPGAPVIHEQEPAYRVQSEHPLASTLVSDPDSSPNAVSYVRLTEGQLDDDVWASCHAIVEDVYETPAQQHIYLEPCTTLASYDRDTERITMYTATQTAFRVQAITAEALGLPMTKIRVKVPRVGGGFGGKTEVTTQPIAAALSRAACAPVKLTLSRTDDIEMMKSRHISRIYMRTGVDCHGDIVARKVKIYFDTGAYTEEGTLVAALGAYFGRGPYRVPNIDVECWCVYTNHLRGAAFRGFGNPQIHYASEMQLERLAAELNMDPFALRERNAIRTGERWLGGAPVESGTLEACLERAKEASNWDQRRADAENSPRRGRRRGVGMAAIGHVCGLLGTSATVRLNEDGTLTVSTGASDIGQGSDTALAQCAAAAMGLPMDQVLFSRPDTDSSPYDWCTAGTRVTFSVGRVITQACAKVKREMFGHASTLLGRPVAELELRPGGIIGVRGEPDTTISFAAIAGYSLYVEGGPIIATKKWLFPPFVIDPEYTQSVGLTSMGNGYFVFAVQVVEVEVDMLTGQVEVLEAWSVHDVGRVINAAAAEGQIQGGVVQGLGLALLEELVWDEDGKVVNASMSSYKVPAAQDVPMGIHPIMLEYPSQEGPFGAKGVAEVGLVGMPAAVCNAIRHATGAEVSRVPATSERVLDAIIALECADAD